MPFLTIRRAAAEVGLPHTLLRKMLANSTLPGFYSGNRYYVNLDLLREKLEEQSHSATKDKESQR